jgi:hypothetical protein
MGGSALRANGDCLIWEAVSGTISDPKEPENQALVSMERFSSGGSLNLPAEALVTGDAASSSHKQTLGWLRSRSQA